MNSNTTINRKKFWKRNITRFYEHKFYLSLQILLSGNRCRCYLFPSQWKFFEYCLLLRWNFSFGKNWILLKNRIFLKSWNDEESAPILRMKILLAELKFLSLEKLYFVEKQDFLESWNYEESAPILWTKILLAEVDADDPKL